MGISFAAIFAAQPVLADSSAAVSTNSSSSNAFLANVAKNLKASYLFELIGPTTQSLSGNTDGNGTKLNINHYAGLGYRLGGKWSIGFTQPFSQNIDEYEQNGLTADGRPAPDAFEAADPYVSINNSRIMGSNFLNATVSGQLRYYAPLSKATINAANDAKSTESGNGRFRALLNPAITVMDGALEISAPTFFYYQLARRSDAERAAANKGNPSRRDYRILPSLIVGYQATKDVQPYIEQGVLLNHFTHNNNRFSKFDDASDGYYVSPGANINVGKKLSLNVAAYLGPYAFDVKKSSLYFAATYVFL